MTRASFHRSAAHLLLAAWLFGVSLPVIDRQHAVDLDLTWGEGAGAGTGGRLREATPDDGGGHCAVCHLQRAFRSAFIAAASVVHVTGPIAAPPVLLHSAASISCVSHLSSRAPPRV